MKSDKKCYKSDENSDEESSNEDENNNGNNEEDNNPEDNNSNENDNEDNNEGISVFGMLWASIATFMMILFWIIYFKDLILIKRFVWFFLLFNNF